MGYTDRLTAAPKHRRRRRRRRWNRNLVALHYTLTSTVAMTITIHYTGIMQ